ncbi:MAG: isoamylase early set domain-containing protein [Sedimentisphaerales bacterium]|jgi:1,4-alpha-glucan branching enzyme
MRTSKFARGNATTGTATIASRMGEARPTTFSATQSCGPCQVGDGVVFVAFYPQANAVQIASDFNNWQPEKTPMKKANDGTWRVRIPLSKGVYRYRLVVDGQWQQDPHNDATEPNPYGGMNSVVKVD